MKDYEFRMDNFTACEMIGYLVPKCDGCDMTEENGNNSYWINSGQSLMTICNKCRLYGDNNPL